MNYIIGEKYYARYERGWQCLAELVKFLDNNEVLMYNNRHGYFVTTIADLDEKNQEEWTMTNEQILMVETSKLAEAGILKYTGRTFKALNMAGEEVTVKEIEPIHTVAKWNEMGYIIKKGFTSEIKFPIWHYTKAKKKDETEEEAQANGHCYMRVASWFRFDQVRPMTEEEKARLNKKRW